MLDMGFRDDIAHVASARADATANLCCSRRPTPTALPLAAQFMKIPQRVTVQAQHEHDKIRQRFREITDARAARHREQIAAALSAGEHARVLATPNSAAVIWWRRCTAQVSARWHCTASLNSVIAIRCWCSSPTARARCWWRPMWRPAGWTSRNLKAVINVDVTQDRRAHSPHRPHRSRQASRLGAEPGERKGDAARHPHRGRTGARDGVGRCGDAHPQSDEPLVPPMATLQIQVERKEKIRAGDVLGALTGDGGIQRRQGRQEITIASFQPMSPFSVMSPAALKPPVLDQNQGQDGCACGCCSDWRFPGRSSQSLAGRRWP